MRFIEKMKSDEDYRRRVAGMVIILAAFLIIGFTIRSLFFSNDDTARRDNYVSSEEENKEQIESAGGEDNGLDVSGSGGSEETIPEQNAEIMELNEISDEVEYDIPEEIQKMIPVEKFATEFEAFLNEADLMTQDTKAESDGVITIDYENDEKMFSLTLNNHARTVITVKIDGDENIEFLYR